MVDSDNVEIKYSLQSMT